jgi:hypothetical protein
VRDPVRGVRQAANRICCRLRGRTEGLRDRPGALRENVSPPAAVAISEVADAIAETRKEQGVGFVKSLPVLS